MTLFASASNTTVRSSERRRCLADCSIIARLPAHFQRHRVLVQVLAANSSTLPLPYDDPVYPLAFAVCALAPSELQPFPLHTAELLSLVLNSATEAKLILDCFLNLAQQTAFPLVRHFPSFIGSNNDLPLTPLETPQMQHAVGLTIDDVNHRQSQILLLDVTHGPIQFVHLVTPRQDLFRSCAVHTIGCLNSQI